MHWVISWKLINIIPYKYFLLSALSKFYCVKLSVKRSVGVVSDFLHPSYDMRRRLGRADTTLSVNDK